VTDVSYDEWVGDAYDIRYRLHPIDVGCDLREDGVAVAIDAADTTLRVSYPGTDGERRVLEGPQRDVLRRLRARGFRFEVR
jgi:hypothetical protein